MYLSSIRKLQERFNDLVKTFNHQLDEDISLQETIIETLQDKLNAPRRTRDNLLIEVEIARNRLEEEKESKASPTTDASDDGDGDETIEEIEYQVIIPLTVVREKDPTKLLLYFPPYLCGKVLHCGVFQTIKGNVTVNLVALKETDECPFDATLYATAVVNMSKRRKWV